MSGTKCEICGEVDCGGGGIEWNNPEWETKPEILKLLASHVNDYSNRKYAPYKPLTDKVLAILCQEKIK
jgi:hypothetical protein